MPYGYPPPPPGYPDPNFIHNQQHLQHYGMEGQVDPNMGHNYGHPNQWGPPQQGYQNHMGEYNPQVGTGQESGSMENPVDPIDPTT